MDWSKAAREILGAVAPVLGTAVGGPLGGIAARVIAGKLLGNENAPQEDVVAAVVNASPADLVKLREADNEFRVQMKKLDVDMEQIAAGDRDSARQREVKTGDVWTPRVLALVVLSGFFATVAYVLHWNLAIDKETALLVGTLIGYVSSKADQVVTYFFGSSAGSKAKDEALALAARKG